MKIQLCAVCAAVRGDLARAQPAGGPGDEWMLFDDRGDAVCPICRARWRLVGTLADMVR